MEAFDTVEEASEAYERAIEKRRRIGYVLEGSVGSDATTDARASTPNDANVLVDLIAPLEGPLRLGLEDGESVHDPSTRAVLQAYFAEGGASATTFEDEAAAFVLFTARGHTRVGRPLVERWIAQRGLGFAVCALAATRRPWVVETVGFGSRLPPKMRLWPASAAPADTGVYSACVWIVRDEFIASTEDEGLAVIAEVARFREEADWSARLAAAEALGQPDWLIDELVHAEATGRLPDVTDVALWTSLDLHYHLLRARSVSRRNSSPAGEVEEAGMNAPERRRYRRYAAACATLEAVGIKPALGFWDVSGWRDDEDPDPLQDEYSARFALSPGVTPPERDTLFDADISKSFLAAIELLTEREIAPVLVELDDQHVRVRIDEATVDLAAGAGPGQQLVRALNVAAGPWLFHCARWDGAERIVAVRGGDAEAVHATFDATRPATPIALPTDRVLRLGDDDLSGADELDLYERLMPRVWALLPGAVPSLEVVRRKDEVRLVIGAKTIALPFRDDDLDAQLETVAITLDELHGTEFSIEVYGWPGGGDVFAALTDAERHALLANGTLERPFPWLG